MKAINVLRLVFPLLFTIVSMIDAYKILGILPTMAKSHHIVAHALMKGLADAGHEVTVISPVTIGKPMKNYREIELQGYHKVFEQQGKGTVSQNLFSERGGVMDIFSRTTEISEIMTNFTLSHPKVQQFIHDPAEHFDVVIMEIFLNEAMLGFGHIFKAPVIALSTFGSSKWSNDLVGTPAPPSHVPVPFIGLTDRMTFTQRLGNTAFVIIQKFHFDFVYMKMQERYYNRAFADPKPDLEILRKNVSLVLLNTHFSLHFPKPYATNMIEVGGMQINRKVNVLPTNIREFIENATHGVVYFSMGSNLKGVDLPIDIRNGILKIFGKLKQRVLWKWEDPELPGKPDNVFISKWFPQDDILSHPNIKLFITHGGLLGSTEAIYHGVPLIGIPVFGDQELNMANAEKSGFGISLPFKSFKVEQLSEALDKMLSTDSYAKHAKVISQRYRDQPMTPLETAVFWVEYVARHKGAYDQEHRI